MGRNDCHAVGDGREVFFLPDGPKGGKMVGYILRSCFLIGLIGAERCQRQQKNNERKKSEKRKKRFHGTNPPFCPAYERAKEKIPNA